MWRFAYGFFGLHRPKSILDNSPFSLGRQCMLCYIVQSITKSGGSVREGPVSPSFSACHGRYEPLKIQSGHCFGHNFICDSEKWLLLYNVNGEGLNQPAILIV